MNFQEIKGIKYYLIYAALAVGLFTYSGMVGWKWFNPTQTTHEKSGTAHRGTGGRMLYHK